MLASKADPKSNEKWWIDLSEIDFDIRSIIQFIISSSTKTGTTLSFTEHFCNNAKQNLWITDPWSYFFIIYITNLCTLITFFITVRSFRLVIYSTPLNVLQTMLINGNKEYLSFAFELSNKSFKNWMFSFSSILNRSFLISS